MLRSLRFVLALLLGLSVLSAVALLGMQGRLRAWFEQDLSLSAYLTASSARQALTERWSQPADLGVLLQDLARSGRVLAAAACDSAGRVVAQTDSFPQGLGCGATTPQVVRMRGVKLRISAFPLSSGVKELGALTLIHDLRYEEDRIFAAQRFLGLLLGGLTVGAALLMLLASILLQRQWCDELRQALYGNKQLRDSQPLLREVREMAEHVAEHQEDGHDGQWNPARLRNTLTRQLRGEKIVILANREPYIHSQAADGTISVQHPASGLVTALEPVMRACSGTWVAHGSGNADRQTVDAQDRVQVPPNEKSYSLRRVWLTPEEETGYYYHFSNEGLWPLCHIAHTRPSFGSEDFEYYRRVNQKFADAVCSEVDTQDPVILVQDYHFALAPKMIRKRLPRATILTFWHIPWPNAERFGICPFYAELLEGLLGSSIIGFHTQLHCNNFIDSVDRFLEARIDRATHAVVQGGVTTLVRAYPISVEWPVRWLKDLPSVADCRAEVIEKHSLRPDVLIGIGVDRIDYTKGIEERLLAVERLLEIAPELRGRFVFIQLGAPSRTVIERYQALNQSVASLVTRINERFGTADGYQPIVFGHAHHEPPAVFRYLRAADLCYVSSLHDGMNLVAKEFIAARDDERGVLVLSHFTGAASELTEALIVNPYDLDEASAALRTALQMPPAEQKARMRAMRSLIAEFNVYRWAGHMLRDAAMVRRRSKLQGSLMQRPGPRSGAKRSGA
jgi:trehalose 6-phosphate synthase